MQQKITGSSKHIENETAASNDYYKRESNVNAFGGEPSMIADSMNITQSIALENMNEMSECGKHYIQNPPVNNGNLTSFNKFDPGHHQKINFYQTQEMKELQEFELLE